MFIYSLKAKTIKFFGLICLCLVAVISAVAFIPGYVEASAAPDGEINYSKIKNKNCLGCRAGRMIFFCS